MNSIPEKRSVNEERETIRRQMKMSGEWNGNSDVQNIMHQANRKRKTLLL